MGKARGVAMPSLELTPQEHEMLRELAGNLLAHHVDEYEQMATTKDGYADGRLWSQLHKREGVRVYKETDRAARASGGQPTLLLLGPVQGNLDDLMFAVTSPTTELMKTKAKFIDDGVIDCKVLASALEPSLDGPFDMLKVTWRYYALSEPRDYVCMEATGFTESRRGERLGYHIVHSVGFERLPNSTHRGVSRANMSVCSIFRQRDAIHVHCFSKGIYDFGTTNDMLNSISLHAIATQWVSMAKMVECAQVRKLARLVEANPAYTDSSDSENGSGGGNSSSSSGGTSRLMTDSVSSMSSSDSVMLPAIPVSLKPPATRCKICNKSFGILVGKRRVCMGCNESVCSKCSSSQDMVLFSKKRNDAVAKRKPFCSVCVNDAARSDARGLLRTDLLLAGHQEQHDAWQ